MYIYDTRSKNDKSLPLKGWLFPCIFCFTITGQTKKKIGRGAGESWDHPLTRRGDCSQQPH